MSQALPTPGPRSGSGPSAPPSGLTLTPVPTNADTLTAAREYLSPLIGLDAVKDADRIDGVLAAASEIVEEYAPGAPQSVRNEASVRLCGRIVQSDYGGIVEEEIGPQRTEYVVNHAAMFRLSGAMGLLSRWKIRRAGVIG